MVRWTMSTGPNAWVIDQHKMRVIGLAICGSD
jgi:hypothetical protein